MLNEEIKAGLRGIIERCKNPLDGFSKEKYQGAFDAYYEQNKDLYEQMETLYKESGCSQECLKAFAEEVVEAAGEKIAAARFKSQKSQKQVDFNFLISVYVIPTILKYAGEFSEPFADVLLERWNTSFKTTIGKARCEEIVGGFRRKLCYITTAICTTLGKGADCYEVNLLKKYRDEYMDKTPEGHDLIEEYYNVAPTIVKRMEREPDPEVNCRELYETYLMPCIQDIEAERLEECQEKYKKMVLDLKARYIS